MTQKPDTTAAATDVAELITDLDGGVFDRKLSMALSQVAAAVVDRETKKGAVTVTFTFENIPGTCQVRCEHKLEYVKPTIDGRTSEVETRATVLHVGRFGALSLAQPSLLERAKQDDLIG